MHCKEYPTIKYPREHPSQAEENIWTTARCNRLLRSINSRIVALRKACRDFNRNGRDAPVVNHRKRAAPDDPSWVPQARPKKIMKTYHGKPSSVPAATKKTTPEASKSILPSPFVRRIQPGIAPSCVATKYADEACHVRRRKVVATIPSSTTDLAEQKLIGAFASLLTQTAPPSPSPIRGPRSLLDSCLRRIPQMLTMKNADFEFAPGENAAGEQPDIYPYLEEEFEISKGQGSPLLRQVIRSHGVTLIADAIRERLISDKTIQNLIRSCHTPTAYDDGERLLTAWFLSGLDHLRVKLATLDQFCEFHDSKSALVRIFHRVSRADMDQLTSLLSGYGRLDSLITPCLEGSSEAQLPSSADMPEMFEACRPVYEASTYLEDIVGLASRTLSSPEHCYQSATICPDLRSTAMTMALVALSHNLALANAPGQPGILCETLYRVAARVRQRKRSSQAAPSDATIWPANATIVIDPGVDNTAQTKVDDIAGEEADMGANHVAHSVTMPFLVAAFVVLATAEKDKCKFGSLTLDVLAAKILGPSRRLSEEQRRLHAGAARFIHQISQGIFTFDRISGADLGLRLIKRLSLAAKSASPVTSCLLRVMANEIATRTEGGHGLIPAKIAEEARISVQSKAKAVVKASIPLKPEIPRYRWENGICEWVAATPRPAGISTHRKTPASPLTADKESLNHDHDQAPPYSPDVLALSPVIKRKQQRHSFPIQKPRQPTRPSTKKMPDMNHKRHARHSASSRSVHCGNSSEDELGA